MMDTQDSSNLSDSCHDTEKFPSPNAAMATSDLSHREQDQHTTVGSESGLDIDEHGNNDCLLEAVEENMIKTVDGNNAIELELTETVNTDVANHANIESANEAIELSDKSDLSGDLVAAKGDDVEAYEEAPDVTDNSITDEDEDSSGDGSPAVHDAASDDSEADDEYESAEEGEEIHVDSQNLRDQEDSLTDEQKEERRRVSQQLKEEGNEMFRCGSFKSAIRLYSRGLRTCPLKFPKDRSIMYSNRAACKMKMQENEEAIRDCSKALELQPQYMKALQRRAELHDKTEKLDEALADFQKILEMDPSQHWARAACMRLPDQIKERNEKLKEEMMGKLKDLGNMILRPFGLSTNNFQLNQDPNSGGYSVNFQQNTEPS